MKTYLNGCLSILVWNKGNIELENGSKISHQLRAETSEECLSTFFFWTSSRFVPNHIADSFFASVYPTITSGKSTKVIIVSTTWYEPLLSNVYDAERQRNDYVPTEVHWSEVPGRDETGKNRQSRTPQNNNSKLSLSVSSLDQLTHSLRQ